MVLIKSFQEIPDKTSMDYLHSNMVLIKSVPKLPLLPLALWFTFQYGSNQILGISTITSTSEFTFQYGSNQISDFIGSWENVLHLHSNMVLIKSIVFIKVSTLGNPIYIPIWF